jgi:hypothetical protein
MPAGNCGGREGTADGNRSLRRTGTAGGGRELRTGTASCAGRELLAAGGRVRTGTASRAGRELLTAVGRVRTGTAEPRGGREAGGARLLRDGDGNCGNPRRQASKERGRAAPPWQADGKGARAGPDGCSSGTF